MSTGLKVGSVTVRYGQAERVSAGPVQLEKGQFVGLLGPNGAGKSSWIKALIGAVPAQIEALQLDGTDLLSAVPRERARSLAYLSQIRTGPPLARVRDVVQLGRHPHLGADPNERTSAVLKALELSALSDHQFGNLSGGEQARVLLARALAVEAPILLADEPVASLDPYYAHQIMRYLRQETQRGTLVIASLHDIALTEQYCDRVLVMNDGVFHAQGAPDEALDPAVLAEIFKIRRTQSGFEPVM